MTNLEAFNKVELHLLAQNKRSISKLKKQCVYRGDDNLMCAIGCLIPDDEYLASFEGGSIMYVQPHIKCLANLDTLMLSDLQRLHDETLPYEWPEGLRVLRDHYFTGEQALV